MHILSNLFADNHFLQEIINVMPSKHTLHDSEKAETIYDNFDFKIESAGAQGASDFTFLAAAYEIGLPVLFLIV